MDILLPSRIQNLNHFQLILIWASIHHHWLHMLHWLLNLLLNFWLRVLRRRFLWLRLLLHALNLLIQHFKSLQQSFNVVRFRSKLFLSLSQQFCDFDLVFLDISKVLIWGDDSGLDL